MSKVAPGSVILDIKSYDLDAEEKEVLLHPQVGGVIFFSRNFADRPQITDLCRQIRQLRPGLLLSVDQEGGRVQRFKKGFTLLPAMAALGQLHDDNPLKAQEFSRDLGWLMAVELLTAGLDISFAPVLDIHKNISGVIGDRAFASQPNAVYALTERFIQGMNEAGMKATGKHFPGHGAVKADSHLELPIDPRPFEQVAAEDMQPFVKLGEKLDAIMPAHIIFSEIDPHPVGFSRKWLEEILRRRLGFGGVIISDDLSMAGAAYAGNHSERAAMALEAGCDAVLVCNNPSAAQKVIEELELWRVRPNNRLSQMAANPASLPNLQSHPEWQRIQRQLDIFN